MSATKTTLDAIIRCMEYLRWSKSKEDFEQFFHEMAPYIDTMKKNDELCYRWIMHVWRTYQKINGVALTGRHAYVWYGDQEVTKHAKEGHIQKGEVV